MGKITEVVYEHVNDYPLEEAIKSYLYQNTLGTDIESIKEYENYELNQRKIRDTVIAKINVPVKKDTVIFGPSIDGQVVLIAEK